MQRRNPGWQRERRVPDWRARSEHTWGTSERDLPIYDEPLLPDDDYESAYRFAAEDTGPEDWGRAWGEWEDRERPEFARRASSVDRIGGGGRGGQPRGQPGGQQAGYGSPRGFGGPSGYAPERGYPQARGVRGEARDPRQASGYRGEYGDDYLRDCRGDYRSDYRSDYRDDDLRDYRRGGGAQPRGEARRYGADRPRSDYPDLSAFGDSADERRAALRRRQGPKGYTRSDERIREDVCERLAAALDIDVSDVSVQVRNGQVELEGTVPQRWMKHGIEDIADACLCVRDVENRVRVRRDDGDQGADQDSQGRRPEDSHARVLRQDERTVTMSPSSGGATGSAGSSRSDQEPRH